MPIRLDKSFLLELFLNFVGSQVILPFLAKLTSFISNNNRPAGSPLSRIPCRQTSLPCNYLCKIPTFANHNTNFLKNDTLLKAIYAV